MVLDIHTYTHTGTGLSKHMTLLAKQRKEKVNQLYEICARFKSKHISSFKIKKKLKKVDHYTRCAAHYMSTYTSFLVVIRKYADGMLINQKCLKCWSREERNKWYTNEKCACSVRCSVEEKKIPCTEKMVRSTKEFSKEKYLASNNVRKMHIELDWKLKKRKLKWF